MEDAHEIIPGVYLGNIRMAASHHLLKHLNIKSVVNCAAEVPNFFNGDIDYKKFELSDSPSQGVLQYFPEAFEYIENARKRGNVLIHCQAGISRSTTILTSYLMKKSNDPLHKILAHIKSIREIIEPNPGFRVQLEMYEKELR